MQNRRNDKNQSELARLMTIATDVVEGQLRHFGYTIIVLTMTTSTKATRVVTGDASIDPDTLATIFRLSCITEAARVGVVTYQVRTPLHEAGEQLEGIVTSGETAGGIFCNWFHPILRDAEGRFTGFGPKQVLPPVPMQSPFSRLMPARAPTAQEREASPRSQGLSSGESSVSPPPCSG